MKKPKYTGGLLKIIFLYLSIGFLVMGLLGLIGLLKPTKNSQVQSPTLLGIIFLSLGAAFFVVQMILRAVVSFRNQLHAELLANGTRIDGTVEKIYLQWYTQYGSQSPYRILYTYTWQGQVYHHKSCLLWEKPDFAEQDPIVVYVGDSGKSTINIH